MVDWIVTYLIIGTVFMFIIDTVLNSIPDADQFNNKERLTGIIIWPIMLLLFIGGIIKEFIDNFKS